MSEGPDISRLIQSHRLGNYERYEARNSYAYAVDLRRAQWAAQSRLGSPLTRALDRAWLGFSKKLLDDGYVKSPKSVSTELLTELYGIVHRLRAPTPRLLVLGDNAHRSPLRRWPIVTAFGTCSGSENWLVVDIDALADLDDVERRFLLGSGVGHLHCGHGPFFACHAMLSSARLYRLASSVRLLMSPWSRVLGYSADRAGALACDDLEGTIYSIAGDHARRAEIPWYPRLADLDQRIAAAKDFDRSTSQARSRALFERIGLSKTSSEVHPQSEADEVDETPKTERPPANAEADTWSLARCDQRLTERLGLF